MKTRILKAILKGINEGLANFDMDDYEDDIEVTTTKKTVYQDDALLRLKMLNLMSKENITKEDILQCIDLYNEFGVQYNPHLDGEEFKSFIRKIISVMGNIVNLNWINTSEVTNMKLLFMNMNGFNGDISLWDTSEVTNMYCMFSGAFAFNLPIGNWDTSNVINMHRMFYNATSFNHDISKWDTSNVIVAHKLFDNCPISEENKPTFN